MTGPDVPGENFEPGSNHLLLTPQLDAGDTLSCLERVTPSSLSSSPLVIVSSSHSTPTLLDTWRTQHGEFPPAMGLISTGELVRSASRQQSTTQVAGVSITTVGADDLTGLERAIHDSLSQWGDGSPLVLWFDSITDCFASDELETIFRFLHVITAQIRTAGAVAYYHLDPTAHTEQTVLVLANLFDTVIDITAESKGSAA